MVRSKGVRRGVLTWWHPGVCSRLDDYMSLVSSGRDLHYHDVYRKLKTDLWSMSAAVHKSAVRSCLETSSVVNAHRADFCHDIPFIFPRSKCRLKLLASASSNWTSSTSVSARVFLCLSWDTWPCFSCVPAINLYFCSVSSYFVELQGDADFPRSSSCSHRSNGCNFIGKISDNLFPLVWHHCAARP